LGESEIQQWNEEVEKTIMMITSVREKMLGGKKKKIRKKGLRHEYRDKNK